MTSISSGPSLLPQFIQAHNSIVQEFVIGIRFAYQLFTLLRATIPLAISLAYVSCPTHIRTAVVWHWTPWNPTVIHP